MKDKISDAIEGIQSANDKVRAKHFSFLLPLSENNPALLYGYWDIFISILRKPEVSNKYYAIHLLANIARVDLANKFDDIFDEFYGLLNDESPVVSPHIASKSGKIIRAKPQYETQIVHLLLQIDKTSKCRHIELQKAYVIEAFGEAFNVISHKDEIIKYVKDLQNSKSPKTRKAAKAFLVQKLK
jgi:hypothetical protein